jgi:hypothetical protein
MFHQKTEDAAQTGDFKMVCIVLMSKRQNMPPVTRNWCDHERDICCVWRCGADFDGHPGTAHYPLLVAL